MKRKYRCVTPTLEGFIQQLAIGYVARGYFYYVTGFIPEGKDPVRVDQTMCNKFGVNISKWSRYRRRQKTAEDGRPLANTQYIRHRQFFVLLCTPGHHKFFDEHRTVPGTKKNWSKSPQYKDVRKTPITYGGYSVGHRSGHVSVRMSRRAYRDLKHHFERMALSSRLEYLQDEFSRAPFEPYGGVTKQMFCIWRATNRLRKRAGLQQILHDCVKTRRRSLRPFAVPEFPMQEHRRTVSKKGESK